MIDGTSAAARRLRELGPGGGEADGLCLEVLSPAEALAEARKREGPVFRLQEADALLALGRGAEAGVLLGGLGSLPAGLAALRDRLSERAGAETQGSPPPARRPAGVEAELRRWLERARSWRAAGGV